MILPSREVSIWQKINGRSEVFIKFPSLITLLYTVCHNFPIPFSLSKVYISSMTAKKRRKKRIEQKREPALADSLLEYLFL